jgi:hypothetical protein
LKDADEANDEYDDRADLLEDDGSVGDEGPEFVGLKTGISLEVLEKRRLVRIVVRVYCGAVNYLDIMSRERRIGIQECFTQSSFFQLGLRRRLLLRLPSFDLDFLDRGTFPSA